MNTRFGLQILRLAALAAVLAMLLPAAGFGQNEEEEDPYGGAWIAELGDADDLCCDEPVLVKAVFRDADGSLMDIEKVFVRREQINKKAARWVVLSAICTYLKCLLEYSEEDGIFRCPCYGCEYDLDGKVLKKPTKKDLPDYSDDVIQEGDVVKLKRWPEEE
jgi:Rieske Fe-S protein